MNKAQLIAIGISTVSFLAPSGQYQPVQCVSEPPGVICAAPAMLKKDTTFTKNERAAAIAYKNVLEAMGAKGVTIDPPMEGSAAGPTTTTTPAGTPKEVVKPEPPVKVPVVDSTPAPSPAPVVPEKKK